MNSLGRALVAPLAVTALLTTTAACGSSSSTDSSSSSSSSSSSKPSGMPNGGPGGAGGGMQTFTAVDLNTNGENAADANTAEVVAAANAFLATLDAATKAEVTYAFTDNQSRQTWSNYPAQQVPRKGVALSDLDDTAKTAAMALVKTMLSAQGYSQVETKHSGKMPPPAPWMTRATTRTQMCDPYGGAICTSATSKGARANIR